MNYSCNVIRDLLPLYVENMVSEETQLLVEEHLAGCSDCQKQLAAMQAPKQLPADTITAPLRKLKGRLFWKRIEVIVLTAALILALAITGVAYLTAPEYLPYSDELLSFHECEDGTTFITFGEKVAGYDLSSYSTQDGSGYVCHITAWSNLWSSFIAKSNTQSAVLKPQDNQTVTVYYYCDAAESDTLIFGKDLHAGGGIATLPRLVLAYYFLIAAALAAILAMLRFVFRQHDKIRNIVEKALLLPMSYLVGHLCIKGFKTSSYSAQRDFFAILLVMIPIYCVFLLAINLLRKYKSTKQARF